MVVKCYVYMGKAVVSARCVDYASGHDHCVWTGERALGVWGPLDVAQTVAEALYHLCDRLSKDQLDDVTDECLG
jgi:hypothetical protein